MTEKTCGSCKYCSKFSPFEGRIVGYCIALGTDSNAIDQAACRKWVKADCPWEDRTLEKMNEYVAKKLGIRSD